MMPGDKPPIIILLKSQNNTELVKHALAGMSQQLFASQYLLELPDKRRLESFLRSQYAEWKKTKGQKPLLD